VVVWYPYIACSQNRFFSFAAYLLKIVHLPRDCSLIYYLLKLPTLSHKRTDDDRSFISSLLDSSIDLLTSIYFNVPSYHTRYHTIYDVPSYCIYIIVIILLFIESSVSLTISIHNFNYFLLVHIIYIFKLFIILLFLL